MKKTGIELIEIERAEQLSKHGYSLNNDKEYNQNGELAMVARYLLSPNPVSQEWPRNWSTGFKFDVDGKNRIHKLKVAGALIAAEIDRLNDTPHDLHVNINADNLDVYGFTQNEYLVWIKGDFTIAIYSDGYAYFDGHNKVGTGMKNMHQLKSLYYGITGLTL